jgi:uncharacterized membrane protein YoaT (DUF817 family)
LAQSYNIRWQSSNCRFVSYEIVLWGWFLGKGQCSRPHETAAARYPALARLIAFDEAIGAWAEQSTWRLAVYEFVRFGVKQGWACLFGGLMLALLLVTHFGYPKDASLARYDFLVIAAIAIQLMMLWTGMETWEEAKVILIFHVVGTVMEIFKTAVGSWTYPVASVLRIAAVPLFTGFMYACVGSYLARVWRLFDFQFTRHPPLWAIGLLRAAIYVNFFTHHYMVDIRFALFVAAAILFGPAWVHFKVWRVHRQMPLLLGLVLVALFIWFAENIGTYTVAWVYPGQKDGWTMVSPVKLGAWFLLMLLSYTMVAAIHGIVRYRWPERGGPR